MTLADDLLSGIAQIAAHLGLPEKKTYNMHKRGLIPTTTVGRSVFARKSVLDRHFGGGG